MPDHDTVLYNLAGIEQIASWGWGIEGDTGADDGPAGRLRRGDVVRARRPRPRAAHRTGPGGCAAGGRLTEVASTSRRCAGHRDAHPADDRRAGATEVRTADGWLEFQEYFVRLPPGAADVLEVRFAGIEAARVTPEVGGALAGAEAIVICPSNPLVSVGPILAVPGMREAIDAARARGVRVAAVSPIVGGQALKGPADRMLASLGDEVSALGVARLYAGLVDAFVLDAVDAALAPAVEALGCDAVVAPTDHDRRRVACAARPRRPGGLPRLNATSAGRTQARQSPVSGRSRGTRHSPLSGRSRGTRHLPPPLRSAHAGSRSAGGGCLD